MSNVSIPVQVLVTSGRFRDNRHANLSVGRDALDQFSIVLQQSGSGDGLLQPSTTEIVAVGIPKVKELVKELNRQIRAAERQAAGTAPIVAVTA